MAPKHQGGNELVKFPRTPHLHDMGSATRDDLVLTEADALTLLARGVVLEEKVDGANLGISFGSIDGPPRCQKRGHWVTPHSEQQFGKLDSWLALRQEALRVALGTRYILYGEWLAARHSVPYNALPDWFLAYDIYDMDTERFLNSRRRDELLRGTGVRSVPAVVPYPGRAFTGPGALEAVRQLVLGLRSSLCIPGSDQWAEGVYLRVEDGPWLAGRAKLVHPAFRQAIEGAGGEAGDGIHWSKRRIEWNRLRPDLWAEHADAEDADEAGDKDTEAGEAGAGARAADTQGTEDGGGDVGEGEGAARRRPEASTTVAAAAAPAVPSRHRPPPSPPPPPPSPPSPLPDFVPRGSPTADLAAARVQLSCGGLYVALVGAAIDAVAEGLMARLGPGVRGVPAVHRANRVQRDGPHHHITLVTPPEMQQLQDQYDMKPEEVLERILAEIDPTGGSWTPIGLGRATSSGGGGGGGGGDASETLFLVVAWPAGHCARAAVGLQREQHFHITLGFNPHDLHGIPKDLSTLAAGRVDPGVVKDLADAATSTGCHFSRCHRAATLVLQVLRELQLTSSSAAAPSGHRDAAAATAGTTNCEPASQTSTAPAPARCLTPATIDCLHSLLGLALEWCSSAPTPAAGGRQGAAGAGRGGASGGGGGEEEDAESQRRRRFVAACAHLASARLAGRCSEFEEVVEHAALAEGVLSAATAPPQGAARGDGAVLRGGGTPINLASTGSSGRGGVIGDGGGGSRDAAGREVAGCGGWALELVAAAACLSGKALAQLERYGEAARELQRAAELMESAGLPYVGGSTDVAAQLLSAVRPPMEAAELRAAAGKCARRVAAAAGTAAPAPTVINTAGAAGGSRNGAVIDSDNGTRNCGGGTLSDEGYDIRSGCDGGEADVIWSVPGGMTPLNPRERFVVRSVAVPSGTVTGAATAPTAAAGGRGGGSYRTVDVTLMRNTGWVVPGVLAGSSTPKNLEQIAALGQLGIGLVITLTEEEPLPKEWFEPPTAAEPQPNQPNQPLMRRQRGGAAGGGGGHAVRAAATSAPFVPAVRNLFVPVPNYEPPSVRQMDEIMAALEDHIAVAAAARGRGAAGGGGGGGDASGSTGGSGGGLAATAPKPAVLIHCGGGKGRAGTVLACYLCKYGMAPPPQQQQQRQLPCEGGPLERSAAGFAAASDLAPSDQHHTRPAMSADAAVRLIRQLRPGSIETEQQQGFVGRYCDELWRRYDRAVAAAGTAAATAQDGNVTASTTVAAAVDSSSRACGALCTATTAAAVAVASDTAGDRQPTGLVAAAATADSADARTGGIPAEGAAGEADNWPPARPSCCSSGASSFAAGPPVAGDGPGAAGPSNGVAAHSGPPAAAAAEPDGGQGREAAAAAAAARPVAATAASAAHADEMMGAGAAGDNDDGGGGGDGGAAAIRAAGAVPEDAPASGSAGFHAADGSVPLPPPPAASPSPPPAASRPQRPRRVAGLPRLVMLVGLPGSGKSTFARALEASGSWSRICQDECGSRGAAEAAFGAAVLRGPAAGWQHHVVLDRCSPDAADRKEWLELGLIGKRDKGIVAVFFDVPAGVCKARVAARENHPTIAKGRGGRIVDDFAARLQPPTTAEGFERVHVVRTAQEAEALLAAWGAGGLMRLDHPEEEEAPGAEEEWQGTWEGGADGAGAEGRGRGKGARKGGRRGGV